MALKLMVFLGLVLLALPIAAIGFGYQLPAASNVVLTVGGAGLLALTGIVMFVTRLYQKTKASESFVRTGAGGVQVIRDGGCIVIPFLHELVRVSLQTIKLEVVRENEDALITLDKLRADIRAEFFVRVQPERESILQASRSLGERMGSAQAVKELVEDKLVSALRTAAASKTLEQLNSERDEFLAEVMKLVADDLRSNGLILETATISKLDQTDERFLKAENIFDAQGRRKIAEITQLNLTERNRLVREGEQARKEQDVETQQRVLEYERVQREAEARQRALVTMAEAEAARESEEKRIDVERRVQLAAVERTKALEVEQRRQEQAVEVAEREKQEKVAIAERQRAAAEMKLAEAEAERERARQSIETVRVTEAAERDKRRQVVEAQAQAEQAFVAGQRRADAEAYALRTQADAQKQAAEAEADALRRRAEAQADAERQRAAGETARAMVPVEVSRAQLDVDRSRLDNVVVPELRAREEHGRVAQEFELAKLRIDAEREVRIASAQASATLFTKVSANLYGTPEDVAKLNEAFLRGQRVATSAGGFFQVADPRTLEVLDAARSNVGDLVDAVLARLGAARETFPAPEAEKPAADRGSGENGYAEVGDHDLESPRGAS
jgi:flotillin